MPAKGQSTALVNSGGEVFAPKIYYFHPLQVGSPASWRDHLRRCREMGFDHLLAAPLFAAAEQDIFLATDHDHAHSTLGLLPIDEVLAELVAACRDQGLRLLMDVVLGRVATDSTLAKSAPSCFHPAASLEGRVDPRMPLPQSDAAHARFDDPVAAKELANWWSERLRRFACIGVAGFRCEDPHAVPSAVWRHIIAEVRKAAPHTRFLAWTPGVAWRQVAGLRGVGFAGAFSSAAWWDGRADWFAEEHELLRGFGTVIGCPEVPFGPRLARRCNGTADLGQAYRHMLYRAAATSSGLLVPMGFEFATSEDMDRRLSGAANLTAGPNTNVGLTDEIRRANALIDRLAALGIAGQMRALTQPDAPATALLRADAADVRLAGNAAVILINPDLTAERPLPVPLEPLPAAAGAAMLAKEVIVGNHDAAAALDRGEVRVVLARPSSAIALRRSELPPAKLRSLPRLVIDHVTPAVDDGRFAVKHVVGESVVVEADVFTDGHDVLAAELLWRPADQAKWRRTPMRLLNNDRWQATFLPERIGRHEFTVEAWLDRYATFCRELEIKRSAGADVSVEVAEGWALLQAARERTENGATVVVNSVLNRLTNASVDASLDLLLAPDLRDVMREAEERQFRHRCEQIFAVEVERPRATFAAWYELFPRSATDNPDRHGTFDGVIRRLPAIRDMGFDVLYLTPIHPIGTTNRKGRNNSLRAEPGDLGSPYAIGNKAGGHDAIDPALGTIDDFRRLRDAAAAHGIELALDFAVQCSPDHPWLTQHPEWFSWRPDGSVRYAENPPKKYEDIVNVDFYAKDAFPGLWTALRDIVFFWAGEGVRIFRVDNPHTKPLPFWEWLIEQVRARDPDIIFLSEAFTRPKMMYRLAKLGFTQSYTYFTWRNTKQEITDYFTELMTSEAKDYFRPHLFVNTPDINPYFLQTSGRPGFLIRAALATTLSGLWGMYSGFELCEATPLPGREEYLDSEKYEIRVRRFDAPGNIISEIGKLNRIRRSNPPLQTHLGLRFFPAHNDKIIFYGKPLPARDVMILVAVSLDPFHAQEATIEVPLWEWNLPDHAAVRVSDLMRETSFVWHGKLQRIRLDPSDLPFAVWRVAPLVGA